MTPSQVEKREFRIRSAWRLRALRPAKGPTGRGRFPTQALGGGATHTTSTFVAAVVDRHGLRHLALHVERVLRHGRWSFMVTRRPQFFGLRVAPHFEVAVSLVGRERDAAGPPSSGSIGYQQPAIVLRASHHESLVSRLLERETRVSALHVETRALVSTMLAETGRRRRGSDETTAKRAPTGVLRVLHRSPVPKTDAPSAAPMREAAITSRTSSRLVQEMERAVPHHAAPIDLASLTRGVMQAIDQRIVAHRERMGRA